MPQSLWDYAVTVYRRPGVAEACLALQDEVGADVNLLLAAAWLAQRNSRWQRDDVTALMHLCADWRQRCLLPLRQVRRYLKELEDTHDLYQRSKSLELEAERYQLRAIEQGLQHLPQSVDATDSASLLRANLETCLDALQQLRGRNGREELARLAQALSG